MIHVFRKHQRWLLFLIAILTIVAFGWLYNNTNPRELGADQIARIYGKTIRTVDIERELKLEQIAVELGLQSYVANLAFTAQNENEVASEFIWNLLVIRHQASELWLSPTDEQVLTLLKSLPVFQTNGQFDREKYAAFLKDRLIPRGVTERHLESLLADVWRFDALVRLVVSPVSIGDKEVADTMRGFSNVDLLIVRGSPAGTSQKDVISDTEVEAYFKANQARYRTPEYRSVEIVRFTLPKDAEKLTGKPQMEAMQKLADQVVAFAEKAATVATKEDFTREAVSAGGTVNAVGPFNRNGFGKGASNEAVVSPDVATAVFFLSDSRPVSDIVQEGNRFVVARLESIEPSNPMNLEEVKAQIVQNLQTQKTMQAEQEKMAQMTEQFFADLKAGKTPASAAAAQGLKTEELKQVLPFTENDTNEAALARLTLPLEEGEWFVATPQGGEQVFVLLKKRYPLDAATESMRAGKVREMLLEGQRKLLFFEWLLSARAEAKLEMLSRK